MILETIVSTVDGDGRVNFAPMGITLEGERVLLRPFREAQTWKNLQAVGEGVVNITDDVLVFARCALDSFVPPHRPARSVRGFILEDVCSWKEFRVAESDLREERGRFFARVVAEGRARDFLGFNAILKELARLKPLVEKTGGPQEREAFDFLASRIAGAVPAVRQDGAR